MGSGNHFVEVERERIRARADQAPRDARAFLRRTDERYDVIIDNVGNHSLSDVRRVLTPGGRYVMATTPIPRWDVPKLNMAKHLTILSAGREKRLYAVPPYTGE